LKPKKQKSSTFKLAFSEIFQRNKKLLTQKTQLLMKGKSYLTIYCGFKKYGCFEQSESQAFCLNVKQVATIAFQVQHKTFFRLKLQ
jgi:hypothetical protein